MGEQQCQFPLTQVLSPEGELVGTMPELSDDDLRAIYRWMLTARLYDERCIFLQRQGRITAYAPITGQEAAQVGSAYALERTDWIFPSYREHAVAMVHGMPIKETYWYWLGVEQAMAPDLRFFTYTVPIATQIVHAVGLAWAAKLKKDPLVVATYFGDGGTSEGDFHEGLNFASVYKAPVVFFCQNNQWAISMPFAGQTGAATVAQKAVAYGIKGVRVDGNDALAVYAVVREAAARARAGEGPTLVEAVTYRVGPHSTNDDPGRYRTDEDATFWREQRDPLKRMQIFLQAKGLWSQEEDAAMAEELRAAIMAAFREAEANLPTDPTLIFDYVYAQPTPEVAEQRQQLLDELAAREDG